MDSELNSPATWSWRHVALGVGGPLLITVAYLLMSAMEPRFLPGEGKAAAARDLFRYKVYAGVMAAFVIGGTLRCRGDAARTAFSVAAIPAALFLMFIAFFGQMAP